LIKKSMVLKPCLISLMLFLLTGFFSDGISDTITREKPYKVILMETMPVKTVLVHSVWFIKQLEELGYKKRETLDLTILKIKGDREYGKKLLKTELEKGRSDLVVTNATLASQIAHEMIKGLDIPQVFFSVSDPVGAGLIKRIGEASNTHITGRVHMIPRETRVNMVMSLIKNTQTKGPLRIGFIHSSYPSAIGDIRRLKLAVKDRTDIKFVSYQVQYKKMPEGKDKMLADTRAAIEKIRDQVDFWWEPSGPLGEINEYTRLLINHSSHAIVMGNKLDSVKSGALLHLTPHPEATGRETALIADAILKGLDPGTIPVTPPARFDLGINITTAIKNNIVIPPDILDLAGDQVFR
jgi:putative tryptophan/tyrosine transport system substrate-binding protein